MSSSVTMRVRRVVRTTETRTVEGSGRESIPLSVLLGQGGVEAFAAVLENSAKMEQEHGLKAGTLAWQKLGPAQYQRTISGGSISKDLEGIELTIQLKLSGMLSEVEYHSRLVTTNRVVEKEKIKEGVQRAVNLEINKLVAMTLAQKVQQTVKQQVQVQGKVDMRVENNLNHRVKAAMRH